VVSGLVKDRPVCRVKDLPHGSIPLRVWVCKPGLSARMRCAGGGRQQVARPPTRRERIAGSLPRAGYALSPTALARLKQILRDDDPTEEIGAVWAIVELLRQLLAAHRSLDRPASDRAHGVLIWPRPTWLGRSR
jgi:hypothetical protein